MRKSLRSVSCAGVVSAALVSTLAAQVAESPEPNSTAATSTPIGCAGQGYGSLDPAMFGGDVDFWSFTTTQTVELRAYVSSRGGSASALSDARLLLLTADGTAVLVANSDYSGRDPGLVSAMPRVRVPALAAGTYQLAVAGQSPLDAGDYALDVRCSAPELGAPCPSGGLLGETEIEPNDTPSAASPLLGAGCSDVSGIVNGVGDEDFFALTLGQHARLRVTVESGNPFGTPLTDPMCELQSADGLAILGADDDDGPGLTPLIDAVVSPGSYVVRVRGFGASTGDYRLLLESTPFMANPPVLADASSQGLGCLGSAGSRLEIALRANEWPQLGTTWTCDLIGLAPGANGLAVAFLGLLPFPAPIDLALLGAPGCLLQFPEQVAIPFLPTQSGEAEFSLPIPASLPQVGVEILLQAIAIDFPANDLGVTTSNLVVVRLGDDA